MVKVMSVMSRSHQGHLLNCLTYILVRWGSRGEYHGQGHLKVMSRSHQGHLSNCFTYILTNHMN